MAKGFLELGVQKGDRVGIWSPNTSEWVLTQYAAAKVGAILVNVNPAYRPHELAHALRLSQVPLIPSMISRFIATLCNSPPMDVATLTILLYNC